MQRYCPVIDYGYYNEPSASYEEDQCGDFYRIADVDPILEDYARLKSGLEVLADEVFMSLGNDVPDCTISFYKKLILLTTNLHPIND